MVTRAECHERLAASAAGMTSASSSLRHASACPPVNGVAPPVGEKAGHRCRSPVGHGCASSHCCHRQAKLSCCESSYLNHMSRLPHSMFSRSHLEGAERPRSMCPLRRDAMTAGVLGRSLPASSTQVKFDRPHERVALE